MGFRFRKSKKILPGVKLNVGKKSVGASIGGKVGGFSINTKRGVTARGSIPSSGVSYTTNLTGGNNMKRSGGGKKPIYKRPWLWVLAVLLIAGLAGMGGQKEAPAQTAESTVTRALPAEETQETTAEEPAVEEPAPAAETPAAEAPVTETAPVNKMPAAEEPVAEAAPAAAPAPQVHDYILNTNTLRFHRPDCASVNRMSEKNKQAYTGTREDLIAQGYDPCDNCNP